MQPMRSWFSGLLLHSQVKTAILRRWDEWHPYGLSDELERIFGDHLSIEGGQGDDRTIARAARLFVREGEAMLTEALEAGLPASSAAETEPAVIFAARWANLFAGQLAEWPED